MIALEINTGELFIYREHLPAVTLRVCYRGIKAVLRRAQARVNGLRGY